MQKRIALVAVAIAAACGDNHTDPSEPTPDAEIPFVATCDETKLVDTLRAIPHVANVVERDCGQYVRGQARCFGIDFAQPIQHATPAGPQLVQHLWLTHRGCERPTLVADWGYSNEYFFDDELSVLYKTNALWIEHRFQGVSVPAADNWDWTSLTIKNGATDMHDVISAFRTHYGKNFVSTGASKGGITATYHHYLYPKDVDGAIPYVAPASRSTMDANYQSWLAGPFPPCAQTLRDAQVAALTTRRPQMIARLSAIQPGFEQLMLEAMTASFDWAFWQYYGVQYCNRVPIATTTDDAFFDFFYQFSGFGGDAAPAGNTEEKSSGALYYEWLTEQGFALQMGEHVRPHVTQPRTLATMEDNFHELFPEVALPAYDGTLTRDVRTWAREYAENLLLVYGQYDPWSGGAMDEPKRATSARFFVPNATHGAQLMKLPPSERAAALAIADRMFGVTPTMAMIHVADEAGAQRAAIIDGKMRQFSAQIAKRRMGR